MGKQNLSLIEFERAKIAIVYEKGYTEKDIAALLHCSKTAVLNDIVKCNANGIFYDRKMSGRPQKTTPSEDCSMKYIVMHSSKSSYKMQLSGKC